MRFMIWRSLRSRFSHLAPSDIEARMADPARHDVLSRAGTVVVKVGTNVLADPAGRLDRARIQSLADQVQRVRAAGRRGALVSSGAIGARVGKLALGQRPPDLPHLQAGAAPRAGGWRGSFGGRPAPAPPSPRSPSGPPTSRPPRRAPPPARRRSCRRTRNPSPPTGFTRPNFCSPPAISTAGRAT